MECNEDEAARARSIAESKLEQSDFAVARRFALKAQTLYPGLDGISQLLTMLDVHISAENKIGGEVDWYGVLGVNPLADDDTLKKQYRKLALLLHPDKNKFIGADGAFKLVSEAWSLLSDKARRQEYNNRRGFKGFQQKAPMHDASGPSAAFSDTQFFDFLSRAASATMSINKTAEVPPCPRTRTSTSTHPPCARMHTPCTRTPSHQSDDVFWTVCRRCGIQFEYLKIYLNQILICPNCNVPFLALKSTLTRRRPEVPRPVPWKRRHRKLNVVFPSDHLPNHNASGPGRNVATAQNSVAGQAVPSSSMFPKCHHGPLSGTANVGSTSAQSSGAGQTGSSSFSFPKFHTAHVGSSSAQNSGAGQTDSFSFANYQQGAPFGTANISSTSTQKSGAGQGVPGFSFVYYPEGPSFGAANIGSAGPSIEEQTANVVQQLQGKIKRADMESHASAGWEGLTKKGKLDDDSSRYGTNVNMAQGVSGFGTTSAFGSRAFGFSGSHPQPSSPMEFTPIESQKLLKAKARNEILMKLSEWSTEDTAKASDEENRNNKEIKIEICGKDSNTQGIDLNTSGESSAMKTAQQAEKHHEESPEPVAMDVPDPDFHDFDQDRTENSFRDNEVWAVYDDEDGMPRFYALIHRVISRNPFQLSISWLNSRTNSEFSSIEWAALGFSKTCGEFRVGRYITCNSMNSFSHRVHWSKGRQGSVVILPQKGEVWALYRNWSSDWNEDTPEGVVHKYDMVMVLDDYSVEQGVSIAPLVKVAGFRTAFLPNMDSQVIKRIPKEEMFRFSHQVPAYLLTGKEADNAPKGCQELDPAATPMELMQVITETEEVMVAADAEEMPSVPVTSLDMIADGTLEPQGVNINSREAK